jgi:hypothetical protein
VRFTNASARNQLRERQRRDRAAAQSLRVRYAHWASLRIEFNFGDRAGTAPAPHLMVMHPPSQAYFVFPCPYADCDGEFDLTAAVTEVARASSERHEGVLTCAGHRTRDRNGRLPCQLTLEYTIVPSVETPVTSR